MKRSEFLKTIPLIPLAVYSCARNPTSDEYDDSIRARVIEETAGKANQVYDGIIKPSEDIVAFVYGAGNRLRRVALPKGSALSIIDGINRALGGDDYNPETMFVYYHPKLSEEDGKPALYLDNFLDANTRSPNGLLYLVDGSMPLEDESAINQKTIEQGQVITLDSVEKDGDVPLRRIIIETMRA